MTSDDDGCPLFFVSLVSFLCHKVSRENASPSISVSVSLRFVCKEISENASLLHASLRSSSHEPRPKGSRVHLLFGKPPVASVINLEASFSSSQLFFQFANTITKLLRHSLTQSV